MGAWVAAGAGAQGLSGAATIFVSETENNGATTEFVQQQASATYSHALTPYLSLGLGLLYADFESTPEAGNELIRESREPRVSLAYRRERLNFGVTMRNRTVDSSNDRENLESESLVATVSWRPRRGPGFVASYFDEANVADEAIFGRDTESRRLSFETFYNRGHWGVTYAFRQSEVENPAAAFRSEQVRHEVRANATRSLLGDRLRLSLSAIGSRLERETRATGDLELGIPVAASGGLFAIDPSPELGELAPEPTLVDGDRSAPAAGEIDIGGANTYRNLGVDLGLSVPVTGFEVSVDSPSDPSLDWAVYVSSDNLFWERVDGVSARFDVAQLRYVLEFVESRGRYVKAVNLGVNRESTVRVTEVRVLRRRPLEPERPGTANDVYRVDASARYQLGERSDVGFEYGFSNDEDLAEGLVRRDFEQSHGAAQLSVGLLPSLNWRTRYQFSEFDDRKGPTRLARQVDSVSSNLVWSPIDAFEGAISGVVREERDDATLLQRTRSAQVSLSAQLLPDLRLTGGVAQSTLENPATGRTADSLAVQQRLEARPTANWSVSVGYGWGRAESSEDGRTVETTELDVSTQWSVTAYLSLTGEWAVVEQSENRDTRQSYGVSYHPGRKLTVSATYAEYGSELTGLPELERATSSSSISLSYRVVRHAILVASYSASTAEEGALRTSEITNMRVGLRLSF